LNELITFRSFPSFKATHIFRAVHRTISALGLERTLATPRPQQPRLLVSRLGEDADITSDTQRID